MCIRDRYYSDASFTAVGGFFPELRVHWRFDMNPHLTQLLRNQIVNKGVDSVTINLLELCGVIIIGSWKHRVLGYGNMNVSWGQQSKLSLIRVIISGECTRVVSPTSSLSQPSFSRPPPLSRIFRPHKRHLSNHLFFLLFNWTTQVYLTLSLGVIIHLRVSSRDIIYQPHSKSLWASWPRKYSLGFKGTDNRRSSSSSGSSKRKDCWHAITREATSKHLSARGCTWSKHRY